MLDDLFSCLICYETFGLDEEQQLVVLKCGHIFCNNCIHQWLTMNKVCPTCRKRCTLKDILSIDLTKSIVAFGKKNIEKLAVERTRLNNEIQSLKNSITDLNPHVKQIEQRLREKQRFLHRCRQILRNRSRRRRPIA